MTHLPRIVTALLLMTCLCTTSTASAQAPDKQPTAPTVDPNTMVALPGETFTMGVSVEEDLGRYGDRWFVDQQPQHDVTVSAFSMDVHEVTVAEFALFLTHAAGEYHYHPAMPIDPVDEGYLPREGAADLPMTQVPWEAAAHYCQWAGKRLPTEAEWEYAAAGVEGRTFPWGNERTTCTRAAFTTGSGSCTEGPTPVGTHLEGATPEGIMELAGNVAEWTGDRYGPYPDAPQTNPTGPDEGRLRVVRGGGWLEGRRWLRTSARWGAAPEHRSANIGFRCVWREDLDPSSVLRGPLTAPADRGRVTDHGPQTSPVAGPEVLASGFGDPIDVVAADGALFVLDAAHGELVRVEMSGESTVVVDALAQPRGLATDRQGVYIASGDRILRWDGATTQEVAAAQQDLTGTIVADADGVYWIAGDTLRGREFGDMVSREATVTGPVALALTDTHLIFTTDGDDDPAQTLVGQMARDDAAVETIYLFGSNLSPLYPSHVRVDRDSGEVSFLARFRSFPNNAYLATDTLATRLTYSPPTDAGRLLAFEGQVYWPTRNSLVRHDTRAIGTTFSYVTPYSDVGGLWTSAAGVVWTDRVTGRLLRAPHEN